MIRKLAILTTLMMLSTAILSVAGCGEPRHKNKKHKKYKKHKKDKYKKEKREKKEFKAKAPKISVDDAKKSAEGIAKYVFRAAFDKDFDALSKVILTEEEAKDFAKPELFKKYVNKDKMKKKFGNWKDYAPESKFAKVKITDKDKFTFKPGDTNKKFKELLENLTKETTVWQAKVIAKNESKKPVKCTLVAVKLKEDNWRLVRIKSCKVGNKKSKSEKKADKDDKKEDKKEDKKSDDKKSDSEEDEDDDE
ncbi:hypothetical protein KKF34_04870 [Myxococcota bacterium]|nr:hypothetical protein [Myxococcota bacterium]MBU1382078.1 hypothetical protein [Myxococcota bacterium]MBU1496192.1 hypothetical protein [Myxococcota bacterium]